MAAAASCALFFRGQRQFARWLLLAIALTALSLKVWYGIVAFALNAGASADYIHALLAAVYAASLLGFCLSPGRTFGRSGGIGHWAAMAALAAVVFCAGFSNPSSLGFVIPMLAVSLAGGWQLAVFHGSLTGKHSVIRRILSALLLTAIAAVCLLPDAVKICYDVAGQGRQQERVAYLTALGYGTVCSLVFCWMQWSTIYQASRGRFAAAVAHRRRIGTVVILAAAAVLCGGGAWLAHWLGTQAYGERTSTLISALTLGANNLDASQIAQIRGLPEEVASPTYASLHAKLGQVRDALPGVRFTYLLGMRGERLVFLIDAEDPEKTATFSPPGEPVKDYPERWGPELAGAATFNGPDRDEWGVWFAACVPIRDHDGKVAGLLGIDYPAAKWLQVLASRRLAAMIVTFSVALLLISLLGFYLVSKEAEQDLLRSRAEANRLALVAKRTDNAVVITDAEGCIEWVNEGFTKISGYSKDEVIGKTPGGMLQHADCNPAERSRLRECLRSGSGFETELTNYHKSGHPYIIHIECQPLVDKLGTLTGFMAIERDVTQARRSSNLLEAVALTSTTLLANRLEPTAWGNILAALGSAANVDRCYIFQVHPHPVLGTPAVSQAAEWNSGTATPQIHNPQLQNFSLHENGYGRWLPELLAGHVISGSVRDFPAEEQPMLIAQEIRSLVVVPIFAGERLAGFMGFDACHEDRVWESWEISILRSAAANIGLRQIVQNEADDLRLARDEAHHAAIAAETANRAKSTFLATMSHEIRTPLNAVIGMASLLETTVLDIQQREFADTILSSSNFLLELITDILDYSRIESGNLELAVEPFALCDLCSEAFDIVRPGARSKPLQLVWQLAPQLPDQIEGDRARIRQILVNLLSNAVKFTARGVILLVVDGHPSGADHWQLTFKVIDSGIGIAPDAIARLFIPFVQADSSTTRRFGGSGLGLAISKRFAEVMGGDITIQSVQGEGSTFIVSLVLKSAAQIAPPAAAVATRPSEAATGHFAKLRILVAEDNLNNQKVICLHLQRFGITADLVADGLQAVVAASATNYDIIFLDLHMPVMDGHEACRNIRALDRAHRPCIIALTANAFQDDRDAAAAAGMDEYLAKPITTARLRSMLDKVMGLLQHPVEPITQHPVRDADLANLAAASAFIDRAQLDTFIDIGCAGYFDVLGDLIREVPIYLENMRDHIHEGNESALKHRLHSLRGILSCFGCVAITVRLASLEASSSIPAEQAVVLHVELLDLWTKSLSAIREWEKSVPAFSAYAAQFQPS